MRDQPPPKNRLRVTSPGAISGAISGRNGNLESF
jgi:hypothetical protein